MPTIFAPAPRLALLPSRTHTAGCTALLRRRASGSSTRHFLARRQRSLAGIDEIESASLWRKDAMRIQLCLPLLAVVAGTAIPAAANAADLPKEGTYDYSVCFVRKSARIDFSGTQFAYSYEETGTAVAKVPGSLFDGEIVRCVGMTASLDGKRTGGSLCEGATPGGDKRLTRFWYDNDGRYQREQVSGTGKFDGLVTTGSVKPMAPPEAIGPGTVKICNHATGTYRLK